MKKIGSLVIIFLSIFLLACTKEKKIAIVGEDEVQVGATIKLELEANFKIEDGGLWTSSNEGIATVNGGIVRGVEPGEVVIQVKTGSLVVEKTILVIEAPFAIIIEGADKVKVGGEIALEVTNPNNKNTFLVTVIGKVPTGIIISGRNKVSIIRGQ